MGVSKDILEKGLDVPIILSHVYAPYFAYFSAKATNNEEAAIVRVKFSDIDVNCLLPFHGFVERSFRKPIVTHESIVNNRIKAFQNIEDYKVTWQDSYKNCGTVLYNKLPIQDKIVYFKPQDFKDKFENDIGPWETLQKNYNLEFPNNEKFLSSFF